MGAKRTKQQPPRLFRGPLSGRVYVVTRYRDLGNGMFEAHEKHDVTDEFLALAYSQQHGVHEDVEDDPVLPSQT